MAEFAPVHLWLGRFGSEAHFCEYFEPSKNGEAELKYRLVNDFQISGLDLGALSDPLTLEKMIGSESSLKELISWTPLGRTSGLLNQVLKRCQELGVSGGNSYVILYNLDRCKTVGSYPEDLPLRYIGEFKCLVGETLPPPAVIQTEPEIRLSTVTTKRPGTEVVSPNLRTPDWSSPKAYDKHQVLKSVAIFLNQRNPNNLVDGEVYEKSARWNELLNLSFSLGGETCRSSLQNCVRSLVTPVRVLFKVGEALAVSRCTVQEFAEALVLCTDVIYGSEEAENLARDIKNLKMSS